MDQKARLRWFAREVLPHEPDVRRWLAGRLRGLGSTDVDEVMQEAYARMWAADLDAIFNPRAYLFVTARHIIGELIRRSRIVSIELMADLERLNIVDEEVNAHRRLSGQDDVSVQCLVVGSRATSLPRLSPEQRGLPHRGGRQRPVLQPLTQCIETP